MPSRFKNSIYKTLAAVGVQHALLWRMRRKRLTTILNLHSVGMNSNPYWDPLDPQVFEGLLQYLSRNFQVCLLGEETAADDPRPRAILSFDDGYYDFIEIAMPLLAKYKMRANMNVIGECVETGKPQWDVQISDHLVRAPLALVNELKLPEFAAKLASEEKFDRVQYALAIYRYLKIMNTETKAKIWPIVEEWMARVGPGAATRFMDVDHIRQAASAGHQIGAHGYRHQPMGLETAEYFQQDFELCRKLFRDKLKMPLEIYAFPFGSHRKENLKALTDDGVKYVLLVEEKLFSGVGNVYPRVSIYGYTADETIFQALGLRAQGVL